MLYLFKELSFPDIFMICFIWLFEKKVSIVLLFHPCCSTAQAGVSRSDQALSTFFSRWDHPCLRLSSTLRNRVWWVCLCVCVCVVCTLVCMHAFHQNKTKKCVCEREGERECVCVCVCVHGCVNLRCQIAGCLFLFKSQTYCIQLWMSGHFGCTGCMVGSWMLMSVNRTGSPQSQKSVWSWGY